MSPTTAITKNCGDASRRADAYRNFGLRAAAIALASPSAGGLSYGGKYAQGFGFVGFGLCVRRGAERRGFGLRISQDYCVGLRKCRPDRAGATPVLGLSIRRSAARVAFSAAPGKRANASGDPGCVKA